MYKKSVEKWVLGKQNKVSMFAFAGIIHFEKSSKIWRERKKMKKTLLKLAFKNPFLAV